MVENRQVGDESCGVPPQGRGMLKAPVSFRSFMQQTGAVPMTDTAVGELSLPLCLEGEKNPFSGL